MKHAVLFVHGAGTGAYEADSKLVASLCTALGSDYDVRYPAMPAEGATYQGWCERIVEELTTLDSPALLVGHSLGGSILLKYLAEASVATPVAGLFLVAAPFWNADSDWQAEYALVGDFAAPLVSVPYIFLYHSRDDDTVPFAHAEQYAAVLPHAMLRVFDGRGHQFGDDLHEVADDIRHVHCSGR